MPGPGTVNRSFCTLPWELLSVNEEGFITLCCLSITNKYNDTGLNISVDRIEDIWNSEYFANVRTSLNSGKRISDCNYCYKKEDAGMPSARLNLPVPEFNYDPSAIIMPKVLELRLSNTCGQKCRMCTPKYSSSLIPEFQKLPDEITSNKLFTNDDILKHQPSIKTAWYKSDMFFSNLAEITKTAEKIRIVGGEPLKTKEMFNIADFLISKGHSRSLSFTLISSLPILDDKIYNKLIAIKNEFINIHISVSVDGYDELNSYIRQESNWDEFNRNLKRMIDSRVDLKFIPTISVFNVDEIIPLYNWIKQNRSEHNFYIPIIADNVLEYPSFMAVNVLPRKDKTEIAEKYNDFLQSGEVKLDDRPFFENIISALNAPTAESNDTKLKFLKRYTSHFDKQYGKNLADVSPRLANILRNI